MSASSRKVSVWLLVILLPVAGYIGWYNYRQYTGAGEGPGPDAQNSKWKYATEEHWLVDETARDITEMLAFARHWDPKSLDLVTKPQTAAPQSYELIAKIDGTDVDAAKTTYSFHVGNLGARLQWKDFIWSPAEYVPWASKVQADLGLAPSTPPTKDVAIVETLTSPTPQILRQESKRLSEALTKAPLDAGLHEQAALVTAAFALREAAGEFSDSRREICRIAAHLTIAHALQPESASPVRKVAEAALQTLVGREAPALALLADLEKDNTPGTAAWARALRMRNTTDWRQVTTEPTLFELRETFLARTRTVGCDFAIQSIGTRKPAPVDDWRRIILESAFGVERGHQFAENSIGAELNSLQSDWGLFFDAKLGENDVVKALSELPARTVVKSSDGHDEISVLGWDLWSAQHQRHLCQSIHATIDFLRDKWGVPEYRDAQKFIRKNFDGLLLLPLLERELTEDQGELPAISQRVTTLITRHLEAVPPSAWGELRYADRKCPAVGVPPTENWAKPPLPFGTTYGICFRRNCINFPPLSDKAWWDGVLSIAPASYDVQSTKLWMQYHKDPPVEVAESTYQTLKYYNLWALQKLAAVEKDRSPGYLDTMQRICELDSDRFFELGNYYREANQPEKAAEAYQKGVDLSPDRVSMANQCGWLVNYLDEHGQAEKALAIANEAAEVYSFRGLETMARLKEKHGQFKEAEDFYKKIAERYEKDGNGPLTAFYLRNQDKDPAFKTAATGLVNQVFPSGMTKVTLPDFSAPPADGTLLTSTSPASTAAGLQAGDVIVALDGYLVHNEGQYEFVRGLTDDPKMQLIVWKGNGYREIAASAPRRRFNVSIATYQGAPSKK